MIWNIDIHHGKAIDYVAKRMGYSHLYLAKLKNVNLKSIDDELSLEIIDIETLKWYADTFGLSVEEMIFAEEMKNPNSRYWEIKTRQALELNVELSKIIALHGIKVDLNDYKK